jgi:hypothetical protein
MTVWNAEHPTPPGGPEFEKKLLREWRNAEHAMYYQKGNVGAFPHLMWKSLLSRQGDTEANVTWQLTHKEDRGDYWQMTGLIRNETFVEVVPAAFLHPKHWNGNMVLWLSERGKQGIFEGDTLHPSVAVRALLERGYGVAGLDLTRQGEALPVGEDGTQTPRVKNPRESAAYTLGYNRPLFTQRVHDVLSLCRLVKTDAHRARGLAIIALDRIAPIAAAARAVAGDEVGATAIRGRFQFAEVNDIRDPNFMPLALRYGDMPTLLQPADKHLHIIDPSKPIEEETTAAVEWVMEQLGDSTK